MMLNLNLVLFNRFVHWKTIYLFMVGDVTFSVLLHL